MKKEILMLGWVVGLFALANNVSAVGQNSPKATEGAVNQIQEISVTNQGQGGNTPEQNQGQPQENELAGTSTPVQNQNQNQQQNQGEENQIQNQEQEAIEVKETGSVVAEQRKSQVANAVHEMLQVAERNGGIGEQVRTIAQAQNQNQEQLEISLEKVQKRNEFAKLFFGPDYEEINKAEQVLVQNREQIEQLNQLQNQLTNPEDQQVLTQQIQLLEQANLEIENSLNGEKGGFSLLGWMFKLFNK